MELDEQEVELLNSVCENDSYLEHAENDVRDQISEIVRDVEEVGDIEPELLTKLFKASRQLLMHRENENDFLYEELRNSEKRVTELQMRTPKGEESDKRYARDLEDEIQQMQVDHQNEVSRLQSQLDQAQKQFLEEKSRMEREKAEALQWAQDQVRSQSSQAVIRDDVEAINAELKRKRSEINHLLDTNARIEDENRRLIEINQDNEKKMFDATENINELTEKYRKMEELVLSRDVKSEEATMDIERVEAEVVRLKADLKRRDQEADAMVDEVTQRTEQFIAMNERKEAEIDRQRKVINEYERRLANEQLAPDKQLIRQMTDQLETAKKNYEELEDKMRQATMEMEQQAEIMAEISSTTSPEMQIKALMTKYDFLNKEHAKLHEQHESTNHALAQTEVHLRQIEEELTVEKQLRIDIESGINGMPEARDEIERLKSRLADRDTERERLTQGIGLIDDQLVLMTAENDELRSQLKMSPRNDSDLAALRHKVQVGGRAQRADLVFLEGQVNELENERIKLKRQLRAATQTIYQRAQECGLTAEQFEQVAEYIQTLGGDVKSEYAERKEVKGHQGKYKRKYEEEKHRNELLEMKLDQLKKERRDVNQQQQQQQQAAGVVIDADRLKDILAEVKEDQEKSPSVEKLVQLLNGSQKTDELGEKIDQLVERINELGNVEHHSAFNNTNFDVLRAEIEMLREEQRARQAHFEEIKRATEAKEQRMGELERELENRENKWAGERSQFEERIKKMETSQQEAIDEQEACQVHLEEFKKLQAALSGGDETKEYLAECVTTLTGVRIELQKQKRVSRIASHEIETLKRKNRAYAKEIAAARGKFRAESREIDILKRNYQRQLQSAKLDLRDTVSKSHYESLEKRLAELNAKLRTENEKDQSGQLAQIKLAHQTEELALINAEKEALVKQLKTSSEKCVKLQDQLDRSTAGASNTTGASSEMTARKKVAILEIAELNERQKAEHLKREEEKLKVTLKTSSERIKELEENLERLAKANLEQHEVEEGLRKRLVDSIGTEEYKQHMEELKTLRQEATTHNEELAKLKALTELEQSQTERLNAEIEEAKSREKVLQEMLDDSSVLESDQAATVLLLKKEIQQLHELVTVHESRHSYNTEVNEDLNLRLIQTEKELTLRDQQIMLLIRAENKRNHIMTMQLGELKTRFAGSVPIESLERHRAEMEEILKKQVNLANELEETRKKKGELESTIAEYQIKQLNMEEVLGTVQHGGAEEKLIKWQQNAEKAKINELKLRRHIGQLETENALIKSQLLGRDELLEKAEKELTLVNQRALSLDVLRAQHDTLVEELRRNLEADGEIRKQRVEMEMSAKGPIPAEGGEERERHLRMETGQLRANMAGLTLQFNQLKNDYSLTRATLIEKEKKLVEQEQLIGEYKIKLSQLSAENAAQGQDTLRAKQELASDAIGFADISSQLIVLEQRAANAEARLAAKQKESEIRAQTISRLEERVREGRDERIRLEKTHDERMAAIKRQLNEDNMRHAQELRSTQREANTSFRAESRQLDLAAENTQLKLDLEKRQKNVKLLLERMKKQREVMHQMQKRITHLESGEKALNAEFVEMENSYRSQIERLKASVENTAPIGSSRTKRQSPTKKTNLSLDNKRRIK